MYLYVDDYMSLVRDMKSEGENMYTPNKEGAFSILREHLIKSDKPLLSKTPVKLHTVFRTDYTNMAVQCNSTGAFYSNSFPLLITPDPEAYLEDMCTLESARYACECIHATDSNMAVLSRASTMYPSCVFVRSENDVSVHVLSIVVAYYNTIGNKIPLKPEYSLVPFTDLTISSEIDNIVKSQLVKVGA